MIIIIIISGRVRCARLVAHIEEISALDIFGGNRS